MSGPMDSDFLMPHGLLLAILFSVLCGVIVSSWGKKLPRSGDWIAGLGLVGLLVLSILAIGDHSIWHVGWIWPKSDPSSIQVGFGFDIIGSAITAISSLSALVVIFNRKSKVSNQNRIERRFGGASLGAAGVSIAWFSTTTWMSFIGISLAIVGGALASAARWDTEQDAIAASSFLKQKLSGLSLGLVGATALASLSISLNYPTTETLVWNFGEPGSSGWFALLLMLSGVFLLIQPFPFTKCLVQSSSLFTASRVTFTQYFPSLASFAILYRFEPELRSVGVITVLGLIAIASAFFTVILGLLQKDWRLATNAWLSSALSMAICGLSFSGKSAALSLLICAGLAACAISLVGDALDSPDAEDNSSNKKRTAWAQVSLFLAVAIGSGFFGFATTAALVNQIVQTLSEPPLLIALSIVMFLLSALVWRLAWLLKRSGTETNASWFFVLSPLLLILPCFAVFWSGTFSGGILPGNMDQLEAMSNWELPQIFVSQFKKSDETELLNASWIHWGIFILAILFSYWISSRKHDRIEALEGRFPRFYRFASRGYGIDFVTHRIVIGLHYVGTQIQTWIDRKFWNQWVPQGLEVATATLSLGFSKTDLWLSNRINRIVRVCIDVPSKALQLIHNGDAQWYLIFAIGSGLAVLIHFLKFRGM